MFYQKMLKQQIVFACYCFYLVTLNVIFNILVLSNSYAAFSLLYRIASRYKKAEALTEKSFADVTAALTQILSEDFLLGPTFYR